MARKPSDPSKTHQAKPSEPSKAAGKGGTSRRAPKPAEPTLESLTSPAPSPAAPTSVGKAPVRARRPADRAIELKPPAPVPPGLVPPAPKPLSAILGQTRAISALRAAISARRVHHAWVFQGPPGVGKFTAAIALAAILLDPTSAPGLTGDLDPEPDSPAQRLLRAGVHPDLHLVTKELAAVSRDAQVRDSKQRTLAKEVLEEFLIEPSTRTGASTEALAAKVFIVDEAELIDPRGQNALLKTLEEPAPGRVIILITSQPERLLPTIRSRCQIATFGPLPSDAMDQWLASSPHAPLAAELDPSTLMALRRFADGSPGLLQLALTTSIRGWPDALREPLTHVNTGRFPVDLGQAMAKLIDEWAAAWVEMPGHESASKDAANKAAARHLLRYLLQHARADLLTACARGAAAEPVLRRIDLIAEAQRQIDANLPPAFVLENMLAQSALAAQA